MSVKRLGALALAVVLCVGVGTAFSQNVWKVAKDYDLHGEAQYNTIQEAVNAAQPNDIIEILDTEVYAEMVTIDGREDANWPAAGTGPKPKGGKNGITIRYVPPTGSTSAARPTIRWQDMVNVSPKNAGEGKQEGDYVGQSNNFATNGALRIIRASGVTIEGIIVDGGGSYPFAWANVWYDGNEPKYPLSHGNAAIAVAVSGNVSIRECEIKNAFIGIAVKDRNTGGVFGNPNPSDNDLTIPLSGFGLTGNHLFEYNKIDSNNVGIFFESSWDRGNTIRYNFIYRNYSRGTKPTAADDQDFTSGAIKFKDNYLSPVAIYNNTFFENSRVIAGAWQVGAQHLLYNNIHGRNRLSGGQPVNDQRDQNSLDGSFPYRMRNSLIASDDKVQVQGPRQDICPPNNIFVQGVQFKNFTQLSGTNTSVPACNQQGQPTGGNSSIGRVASGTPIVSSTRGGGGQGGQGGSVLPSDANVRWLEVAGGTFTDGGSITLPNLFESIDPASPNFLVPKWTDSTVLNYIRGKGWADGTRNPDGTVPDIGAAQFSGKRPGDGKSSSTPVRIMPSYVVLISGTKATADLFITGNLGSGMSIKYIRWVAPIPDNKDKSGRDALIIPATAIQTPTGGTGTLKNGNNRIEFTLPRVMGTNDQYGFFEVVVASADGKTTDVGFLPYRKLEYFITVEFFPLTGAMTTPLASVKAGEQVRMRLQARSSSGPYSEPGKNGKVLDDLAITLLSDPDAFLYCAGGGTGVCPASVPVDGKLTEDRMVSLPEKVYNVYFTKAGEETVRANGQQVINAQQTSVFMGIGSITVLPGDAAQLQFRNPTSLKVLGDARPPVINRGTTQEVLVEVQDAYGNTVRGGERVNISVDDANIGDVDPKTITTDSTGVAHFTARVVNGVTNNVFTMTATLPSVPGVSDEGRFRVGRVSDQLMIFYSDTGSARQWGDYYDATVGIQANTGDWVRVTVKAVAAVQPGDTVIPSHTGFIYVEPDNDALILSATAGGAPATMFQMTGGVATFWVSSNDGYSGCVAVSKWLDADRSIPDNGIQVFSRCDIVFEKPSSDIRNAVVFGNGLGQPDSLIIRYDGVLTMPDSVTLRWPTASSPGFTVGANRITEVGDLTLGVSLRGLAFPVGYTGISGTGTGLASVWLNGDEDNFFHVLDGIGPVISAGSDGRSDKSGPQLIENLSPATVADVLILDISEEIREITMSSLEGASIYYSADTTVNSVGVLLNVETAMRNLDGGGYRLVLALGSTRPLPGGYIRLVSTSGLTDQGGVAATQTEPAHPDNPPRADNRWVLVTERGVPPAITSAWYTSDPRTGLLDYLYVEFNKVIELSSWVYAKFDSPVVDSVSTAGSLALVDGSPRVIRLDLKNAFPKSQNTIFTGGGMNVTVGFARNMDWPPLPKPVEDKASPVLARTAILGIGGSEGEPDTLHIIYSEPLSEDARKLANPVRVALRTGLVHIPDLNSSGLAPSDVQGTSFQMVSYLVMSGLGDPKIGTFPTTGDSVSIYPGARLADGGGNEQIDENNRKVPLEIRRGPIKWDVVIKNNPFKGGSGSNAAIELSPNVKGATVKLTYSVRLYDNLGNLVIYDKDLVGTNIAEWQWSGQNNKGRVAGTGTYLFKAVCDAKVLGADNQTVEKEERYSVIRSIGFVR